MGMKGVARTLFGRRRAGGAAESVLVTADDTLGDRPGRADVVGSGETRDSEDPTPDVLKRSACQPSPGAHLLADLPRRYLPYSGR